MMRPSIRELSLPFRRAAFILAAVLLCAKVSAAQSSASGAANSQPAAQDQDKDKPADKKDSKSADPATTKLRIHVTAAEKPVGNASIYVRFPVAGGMFHHDKLAELNLKTNEDGSAKVPDIPRGKILIQVVAKGWKTYGKWFDIDTDAQTIEIKLEPPPHWY
jgi:hypothetical protein